MRRTQQTAAVVIFVLVGFTIYGFWATRQPLPQVTTGKTNPSVSSERFLVDQSPLKTAQQLAQLVALPEERPLAQQALRLADYEVDLAFDAALRHARLHPPALTPEAKEAQGRLQKAQKLLGRTRTAANNSPSKSPRRRRARKTRSKPI